MNINHFFETCHVSQAVDGSLVLIKLSGRLCLALKGFEILADSERTELIVMLKPDDGPDRPNRGPVLLRLDEDLSCLNLGKGFLLDLLPQLNEVDIVRLEVKPILGSILVLSDKIYLPTITEDGVREFLDFDSGELVIDIADRDATIIKQWRLGIPTHASGEDSVCWLLRSAEEWGAGE